MSRLKDTDEFWSRMKGYEATETGRCLDPHLPVYARIDGRAFSTFTRGMDRPFDSRMIEAMVETTKHLVHETHARIGYTQSDEISLIWLAESAESDILFSGKIQKMASVLASMAAAKFATVISLTWRERLPHFDCRVFQLPDKMEAANVFLWRAMDARKNAISMAAQSEFSHRQLYQKGQADMLAMLADAGVDFEIYPTAFRRGTFVRREVVLRLLTEDELERIPEKHRPTGPVIRSHMAVIDMPPFNKVTNRVGVIFDGADPQEACEKPLDTRPELE